jgi:hypothetical protein
LLEIEKVQAKKLRWDRNKKFKGEWYGKRFFVVNKKRWN